LAMATTRQQVRSLPFLSATHFPSSCLIVALSLVAVTVWRKAHDLVSSSGALWQYQQSPELSSDTVRTLRDTLPEHFRRWRAGQFDKQNHPLYLCCTGPGLGKSRLLQEMPVLLNSAASRLCADAPASATAALPSATPAASDLGVAQTAASTASPTGWTSDYEQLRAKLAASFVFTLSFSNGTPLTEKSKDADQLIGTRMMWQLIDRTTTQTDWSEFASRHACGVGTVLRQLSRLTGRERKEQTVILLVDELQQLPHAAGAKDSLFARAVSVVAGLINSGTSSSSTGIVL
jgi:hypothetical protein